MKYHSENGQVPETKRKLVEAGVRLMREKGYNATTVDDICHAAGVTKGAYFHYFDSKEDIAKAALQEFSQGRSEELVNAPFRKLADPLDRIYGRLDFVESAVGGSSRVTKGCLIGMLAQELSFTSPELRSLCNDAFLRIARELEHDLEEAKAVHTPVFPFEAKNVAMFYVSIFQGSSMMAKASASNAVLIDGIEQFRHYLDILFGQTRSGASKGISEVLTEVDA